MRNYLDLTQQSGYPPLSDGVLDILMDDVSALSLVLVQEIAAIVCRGPAGANDIPIVVDCVTVTANGPPAADGAA